MHAGSTASGTIPSVLFAGGGSGGHISPGLAIAEALQVIDARIECLFAPSKREIDRSMLQQAGAEFIPMPARPLTRSPRGIVDCWRGYRATMNATRGLLASRRIDRVVALGGFVSAPVVSVARRAGLPVLLLNLDRVPGRANRMVARKATTVLSAVQTIHHGIRWPAVGLPIRQAAQARATPEAARSALGLDPRRETLLITGASQGARTINELMPRIGGNLAGTLASWQVLHLCGDEHLVPTLQAQWDQAGFPVQVRSFLHEMGQAWGAASLCISRAGANSVAEAWASAVPTIFLPYPHHRDMHQQHNAQPMVDTGGAVIVEDRRDAESTRSALEPLLLQLLVSGEDRTRMREALVRESPGNVAAQVAQTVIELS